MYYSETKSDFARNLMKVCSEKGFNYNAVAKRFGLRLDYLFGTIFRQVTISEIEQVARFLEVEPQELATYCPWVSDERRKRLRLEGFGQRPARLPQNLRGGIPRTKVTSIGETRKEKGLEHRPRKPVR